MRSRRRGCTYAFPRILTTIGSMHHAQKLTETEKTFETMHPEYRLVHLSAGDEEKTLGARA